MERGVSRVNHTQKEDISVFTDRVPAQKENNKMGRAKRITKTCGHPLSKEKQVTTCLSLPFQGGL